MKPKALRIVIAGYGPRAEAFAREVAGDPSRRLVAVADPDPAALQRATSLYQVSTFDDFGKLLAATDADVAAIDGPAQECKSYAAAAAAAGMSVLLLAEKASSPAGRRASRSRRAPRR